MIDVSDVVNAMDAEILTAGKIHPISFTKIMQRTEVLKNTADYVLLESIMQVLTQQGKVKRINGSPPLFLKV